MHFLVATLKGTGHYSHTVNKLATLYSSKYTG